MNEIKYHYFGNRGKARTNVITFATVRQNNLIYFSFSCSSIGDIYCKTTGRIKAVSRLSSPNLTHTLDFGSEISKYKTVNNYLANFILDYPTLFPSWAQKIIKRNENQTDNKHV